MVRRNRDPRGLLTEEKPEETLLAFSRDANFARVLRAPPLVSFSLLATIVLVHLGVVWLEMLLEPPPGGVVLLGAKIDALVDRGQWWRLWTAVFLHGNLLHLAFNGYGLFVLGPLLERFYGPRRMLILFVLSGLGASASSYWWTDGASVGASGAIFGLLGALVVFGLRSRRSLPPRVSRAFGMGLLPWVGVNLALGLIPGLAVDNAAHVGGLVSGALLGLLASSSLDAVPGRVRGGFLHVGALACVVSASMSMALMMYEVAICYPGGVRLDQCYPQEVIAPEATPAAKKERSSGRDTAPSP